MDDLPNLLGKHSKIHARPNLAHLRTLSYLFISNINTIP
jgi:hypothetical protein